MYKVCINLIYINVCVYYECGCSEMFVNKKICSVHFYIFCFEPGAY